jgi:hypothetical protein
VAGKNQKSRYRNEHRVPVQDASVRAGAEIGPQGEKERAGGVQRNSPHDVAEGGAKKDCQ